MTEHEHEQTDERADFGQGQTDADQADQPPLVTPPPADAEPAPDAGEPADGIPGDGPQFDVSDEEVPADTDATAPTEGGDPDVPFRPSSDFEQAAE